MFVSVLGIVHASSVQVVLVSVVGIYANYLQVVLPSDLLFMQVHCR